MTDPFNGRSRNPRVRLVVGAIIFLGAVGSMLYHARWIRSAFQGPKPITLAALQEVKDPETLPNPWVSFQFDEAIDTGFVMESTKKVTTTPRSKYLLIRVGNRWLIADVPAGFAGNQVVGYLDTWWSPLSRKVIDQITGRFTDRDILPLPAQRGVFLPGTVLLDAEHCRVLPLGGLVGYCNGLVGHAQTQPHGQGISRRPPRR